MRIDINAFVGRYPFRRVEGGSPAEVLQAMVENGIDQAWISNLSAIYWKDPTEGNSILYAVTAGLEALRPVPALHPGLANWRAVLAEAVERAAPAVRIDPTIQGELPTGAEMTRVVHHAAELGVPLMMAVRLEDGRQRHPSDGGRNLDPAMIRSLVRLDANLHLIVTHADREFIEQVFFGSTATEADRILWDISWIWGPPMDDLAHLVAAMGPAHFAFGTGMPLRIPESSVAKLELSGLEPDQLSAIDSGNVLRLVGLSGINPPFPSSSSRRAAGPQSRHPSETDRPGSLG